MKTVKIVGIVVGALALMYLIYWLATKDKDVVTGVSNKKIQESAESAGIPKEIAKKIADAPDSGAAAKAAGASDMVSAAIANGLPLNSTPSPTVESGSFAMTNIITTPDLNTGALLYVGTTSGPLVGGNITPDARIKPWGGKMENGTKMCFDTSTSTYVPCPNQNVSTS